MFRSAAFFHLKQFRSSIADVDNAILTGYPSNSLHKLLERKGKCLLLSGEKHAAIEVLNSARQALLEHSNIPQSKPQNFLAFTDQLISDSSHSSNDTDISNKIHRLHDPLPNIEEKGGKMQCAAAFVRLAHDDNRGRGLYLTRDVEAGQLLMVEKPYMSVVLNNYSPSHCNYCCSRCFSGIPCRHCVDVVYCSEQCRMNAHRDNHQTECGLLQVFDSLDIGLGHLAYKVVSKVGWHYISQHTELFSQSASGCAYLGSEVCSTDDYMTTFYLLGHSEKRSIGDLWRRAVKSAFLALCLDTAGFLHKQPADHTYCDKNGEDDDLNHLAGHILHHLMMLPCNAHEVSEMAINWTEPSASKTLEIGSAIYPVLSLINHSCDPSVVRHSYSNMCVVRAIRNISAGEELLDNYGALYPIMDRLSRQQHLQNQYFFQCACIACSEDWPMYPDIPTDTVSFNCEMCRAGLSLPPLQCADSMKGIACKQCGHRQDLRKLIMKVAALEAGFQDVLHGVIFRLDVSDKNLNCLLKFLQVVDRYVHRPYRSHNDCQEAVKMCLSYKANAFPRAVL